LIVSEPLIIGCGNTNRGDDAAGLLVVRHLRSAGADALEFEGDGLALVALWTPESDVILIDAMRSGRSVGDIAEWDAHAGPPPPETVPFSTHSFGVGQGIELARVIGRLPRTLRVFGIEGERFDIGAKPSEEVIAAAMEVARRILARS
jgi:hydrogenase maturation protease